MATFCKRGKERHRTLTIGTKINGCYSNLLKTRREWRHGGLTSLGDNWTQREMTRKSRMCKCIQGNEKESTNRKKRLQKKKRTSGKKQKEVEKQAWTALRAHHSQQNSKQGKETAIRGTRSSSLNNVLS